MKYIKKPFFTFNTNEQKGIFILLVILLVTIALNQFSYLLVAKERDVNFEQIKNDIRVFEQSKISSQNSIPPLSKNNLPFFNPNEINDSIGNKLGLSSKQIQTIKNYLLKGGHFKKKEDLKKIYGITEQTYKTLEPYIVIPSDTKTQQLIELNTADTITLKKLAGIGSVLSKRIVKYRYLLGGFYSAKQLLEVYGFPNNLLEELEPNITIDQSKIKKININTSSLDILKKHPYINYDVANNIYNYRIEHGGFNSVNDILKIKSVTTELFAKLSPYITTE